MNSTQRSPLATMLYIVGAILIAVGIGITIRLVIAEGERENLKGSFVETDAVVDEVEVHTGRGENSLEKIVWAHYYVDGEYYDNVRIYDYPATVKEGDHLPIYYDPNDPKTIIHNPGRGTTFGANLIGLVFVIGGIAAIFFAGRSSKNVVDTQIESRYKSYEEYGGETTERAGTLFDREISPADLKLDKPKPSFGRRRSRRYGRGSSMFENSFGNDQDPMEKYAKLLGTRPDAKPTAEDYIHEYTQGGNPAAAAQYEKEHGSGFDFYQSPESPDDMSKW